MTETRRRLSRGSSDVQVSHSQPIDGTPVEVPVPRKVSFIPFVLCSLCFVLLCVATEQETTKYKVQNSPPSSYIPSRERASFLRSVDQRHVLHAQIVQQSLDHVSFRHAQVSRRFLLQHSENVNPVLSQLGVDFPLVRDRVLHHPER